MPDVMTPVPLPQLLLIGATGRNVGKTEYACRLVSALARQGRVDAAKITVIREGGSSCPRGGEGCGVCGSLADRPFILQSEDCVGTGKDTHRLRASGAERVWWLRVRRADLAAGIAALAAQLTPGVPVIAESNSARLALEPGLFLMLDDPDGPMKPTSRAVLHWADARMRRVGDGWDVPPERMRWQDGRWSIAAAAGGVILAAGASSRMGTTKSLLPFDGQPLIARITAQLAAVAGAVRISTNDATAYAFLGLPVVPDRVPGQGPLMGLSTILPTTAMPWNLVVGCDLTHVDVHVARCLLALTGDGIDAVVPRTPDGHREPLFAAYHQSCLTVADAMLANGERRMMDFLDRLRVRYLDLPSADLICNLNTPVDYRAAVASGAPPC